MGKRDRTGHIFLPFGLQGSLNLSKHSKVIEILFTWSTLSKFLIPFTFPSASSNGVPDYIRNRGCINVMSEANVERSNGVFVPWMSERKDVSIPQENVILQSAFPSSLWLPDKGQFF